MTQDNAKNTTQNNKQDAQKTDSRPDFNPTTSQGTIDLDKWIEERAKKSEIKSELQTYKVILIDKDKPTEWALKLHYPGTITASRIQTRSLDDEGHLDLGKLFQMCVDYGVIVVPHISNVEDFTDKHTSFGEAVARINQFLNAGIDGEL